MTECEEIELALLALLPSDVSQPRVPCPQNPRQTSYVASVSNVAHIKYGRQHIQIQTSLTFFAKKNLAQRKTWRQLQTKKVERAVADAKMKASKAAARVKKKGDKEAAALCVDNLAWRPIRRAVVGQSISQRDSKYRFTKV